MTKHGSWQGTVKQGEQDCGVTDQDMTKHGSWQGTVKQGEQDCGVTD